MVALDDIPTNAFRPVNPSTRPYKDSSPRTMLPQLIALASASSCPRCCVYCTACNSASAYYPLDLTLLPTSEAATVSSKVGSMQLPRGTFSAGHIERVAFGPSLPFGIVNSSLITTATYCSHPHLDRLPFPGFITIALHFAHAPSRLSQSWILSKCESIVDLPLETAHGYHRAYPVDSLRSLRR